MQKKFGEIILPILAGTFRILLTCQIIVFTSPILVAAASNLYIVIGFYALSHALKHIKQLTPAQQRKHRLFFRGCCVLFISRGITDLYRYLSPIYGFHINATFLLQPTLTYPPLIEIFANNLPIISLSILTTLAVYHLITAKPNPDNSIYHTVLKCIDCLFIAVSVLLCLTHVYASLTLLFSSGYCAAIFNPYTAVYFSHKLSALYEPLASLVLFAPRFNRSNATVSDLKSGQMPARSDQSAIVTI